MKQFGTLYKFELKKIVTNKITGISFILMIVTALIQGTFNTYAVGGTKEDNRPYFSKLSGRMFDNELYQELMAMEFDEYGWFQNPEGVAYNEILYYIRSFVGGKADFKKYDAEQLYKMRTEEMTGYMHEFVLTEGEIQFWNEMEQQITKPFVWEPHISPDGIFSGLINYNVIGLLFIMVCLSSVFAGEHHVRADQMILCTRYGKAATYYAKIIAGVTFVIFSMAVIILVLVCTRCINYGTEGFRAVIQLVCPFTMLPYTNTRLLLITGSLLLSGLLLYGMCTMFFSEWLKNGVAVMGVMISGNLSLYVVSNIVPHHFRILSQILQMNPLTVIAEDWVSEFRLIRLGGHYLMSWQAAPILYMMICVVLFFVGKKVYLKYQVGK